MPQDAKKVKKFQALVKEVETAKPGAGLEEACTELQQLVAELKLPKNTLQDAGVSRISCLGLAMSCPDNEDDTFVSVCRLWQPVYSRNEFDALTYSADWNRHHEEMQSAPGMLPSASRFLNFRP